MWRKRPETRRGRRTSPPGAHRPLRCSFPGAGRLPDCRFVWGTVSYPVHIAEVAPAALLVLVIDWSGRAAVGPNRPAFADVQRGCVLALAGQNHHPWKAIAHSPALYRAGFNIVGDAILLRGGVCRQTGERACFHKGVEDAIHRPRRPAQNRDSAPFRYSFNRWTLIP